MSQYSHVRSVLGFRGDCLLAMITAASVCGALTEGAIASQATVFKEDFESGNAVGWWGDFGWNAVTDRDGFVYRGTGNGHSHSGYDGVAWGDSTLTVRFQLAGDVAHISYRHQGVERYILGISDSETRLSKQIGESEIQNDLASGPGATYGAWHTIAVTMLDGTLSAQIDGAAVLTYTDPAPISVGGFSFESFGADLLIDDVTVLLETAAPAPQGLVWTRTGGPLGGLGYDIRMRPGDPELMYVSDAFAGVFKSDDGGSSWMPINEGITARTGESGDAIPVFCLTIDPNNADILWIGTQGFRGVFRSVTGGDRWEEKVNGIVEEGITFRGVTVEPANSQVVYLAAEIPSWIWSGTERPGREFDLTKGVIYKSTDAGNTWSAVWRGDNLARYVWVDPRDTDVVYASTGIFDREAANSDPDLGIPGGEGILKSTDGGRNWIPINNGLSNLYVGSLYMHPEDPDVLLAGTGNIQYSQGGGAYVTEDGGATWKQTLEGEILQAVEFSTSDPDIAYAGNDRSLYRSVDRGRTWSLATGGDDNGWGPRGVRAGFPIDFQADPRDPDRLFANNYGGGNFRSVDRGKTWTVASKGYTGAQTRSVVVSGTAPGTVFAAARSGIYGSTDGGTEWVGLSSPPTAALEWQVVAVDPSAANHLLAANNWHNMIWQSRDSGQNWESTNIVFAGEAYFRTIEFAPSNPSIVYAGSAAFRSAGVFDTTLAAAGVFVSRDGGESWTQANDATSADAQVTSLAISPANPNLIYAATGNHGVLRSEDGGNSWRPVNDGLPSAPAALSVVLHPDDSDVIIAGLESGGVYRSDDGGTVWRFAGVGMDPQASVSCIVLDPTNTSVMFAADRVSGVYRSGDGGHYWQKTSDGLRNRSVNDLAMTSDGEHLYAATEGEGVYRLDIDGTPPSSTGTLWETDPTSVVSGNSPADGGSNDTTAVGGSNDAPADSVSNDGPANGGSTRSACGRGTIGPVLLIIPALVVLCFRRRMSP